MKKLTATVLTAGLILSSTGALAADSAKTACNALNKFCTVYSGKVSCSQFKLENLDFLKDLKCNIVLNQSCGVQKPETQAPETQKPETQKPETQAPETQKPETQAPETQAPETQAPETQKPETQAPETQKPEADNSTQVQNGSYAQQVLSLVNAERQKAGLSALTLDTALNQVAYAHSKDMATRNFFSHQNPDGKSPFDRMKAAGISYKAAAENIAAGQATPQAVVNGWMNSEGHRKNILNGSFNKMGLGYYASGSGYNHYWTQCFTD